jgi:hypothetical protein
MLLKQGVVVLTYNPITWGWRQEELQFSLRRACVGSIPMCGGEAPWAQANRLGNPSQAC